MKKLMIIGLISSSLILGGCFNEKVNTNMEVTKKMDFTQSNNQTSVEWQKFNFQDKGISISIPKDWVNESEIKNNLILRNHTNNQVNISFLGDEEAHIGSTAKQEEENILSTATFANKNTALESLREDSFIREDLILGKNTVYKLYHPGYKEGSYVIRLKNNIGFVEFIVSKGVDETIIKSILERVDVY